jgi:hypothetical protein
MVALSRRLSPLLVAIGLLLSALTTAPASAQVLTGTKHIVVLRVYFHDYANTSRYTQAQIQTFFNDINTLWGAHSSYGNISLTSQVSTLFQLPGNRSDYIDTPPDAGGDLSSGGKFTKVLTDAIANSPAGINWSTVDAVVVVMAETNAANFHRGQGGKCNLPMGPGSSNTPLVGCAIFSENPSQSDVLVWGRFAHEIGHAFQRNTLHPSNYNSSFEQMDANYPGQTGVFEKQTSFDFGWMPDAKYRVLQPATGGDRVALYAEEYDPSGRPNLQAIRAYITGPGSAYYLVSVRRKVLGDDLNGNFNGIPDEGVLIERVTPGGAQLVTLQGNGGDRDKLWHQGEVFTNAADGITISVLKKDDDDDYVVGVAYGDQSHRPDVGLNSWLSPPGNTYETTDIWIDSPVNGYDVYRYPMWSDLMGGTVPSGNGDDPAIGQVNRIYARVRNYGTATATNVVVHFDVTDPIGLGVVGSNGFKQLGTVTSAQFPGLASIAPGGSTDVYIEWTPNATLTPQQIAEGTFFFHTCVRVRLDHLPNETIFGNQDGDGQQENIDYFQAPAPGGGAPQSHRTVIHLRNDSFVERKYFYVDYDRSQVPPGWKVSINGGHAEFDLAPNASVDFPVEIVPITPMPAGRHASVVVTASSFRLLANDKNPADKHPEFKTLGGVRVEGVAVDKARIKCTATRNADGVVFTGLLGLPRGQKIDERERTVFLDGLTPTGQFLPHQTGRAQVAANGAFRGVVARGKFSRGVCLFAGTNTVSSAMSQFTPVH